MFTVKDMERIFGTRKYGDFLKPRIIPVEEMRFPIDSALYWEGEFDKLNKITKHVASDIKTYVIELYFKNKEGAYKTTSFKRSSYVALTKKEDTDKKFNFISNRLSMGLTSMNKLLVFDFTMLGAKYKYTSHRDNVYYQQYNMLSTMIDGMIEPNKLTSRNAVFIPITIPSKIPSLANIKKYRLKKNHYLTDYLGKEAVGIAELINYIYGDPSVFDKLNNNENTYIIFKGISKITISKLSNIKALNKDNEVESTIKGVNKNTAILTFLSYIVKTSIMPARTIEELSIDSKTDVRELEDSTGKYLDKDLSEEYLETIIAEQNEAMETLIEPKESFSNNELSLKEELEITPLSSDFSKDAIDNKVNAGIITEAVAKKLNEKAKLVDDILKDAEVSINDLSLPEDYKDNDFVVDKHLLSSTNEGMIKQYINNVYPKNIKAVIYSLSASGNIVTNHTVKTKSDVSGETEEHVIELINDKGTSSTMRFFIPKLREDGTMLQNGNTYIMRRQKAEIPIVKVDASRVALSSYYSKLFVSKAEINTNDLGAGIYRQLLKNEDVSILVKGTTSILGEKIPDLYSIMARKIKSFNLDGVLYSFDFKTIDKIFDGYSGDNIVIGKKGKVFYSLDTDGNIYIGDKLQGSLLEYIGIDISKLPTEYANLQLMGERIPMVIVLSYYFGLDSIITKLNTITRVVDNKKDIKPNEYSVSFQDGIMVFDRNDIMSRLVFGALTKIKSISSIEIKELNNKEGVLTLMSMMGLPLRLPKELDLLKGLWVDPITKDILKIIKEPTTFTGLLFRAVELLTTEYSERPNYIKSKVIKGYDRLAGMVYRAMVTKIREHEHKLGKVTSKLNMNPYDIMTMLSQDSTYTILDDLNPLASIKHKEEITMTGLFGRDSMAISEKDREYDESAIGVISEATKDSGDVGITTFLSAAPNINNVYGVITDIPDIKDLTNADIYSTISNLMALSDKDDGKRMLTSSIMASHMVPTVGQAVFPINRGMEAIIPYKVSGKYISYATEEGVVVKTTTKYVEIEYKSGKKKYPLNRWTTKEEGGLTYTHTNISDLTEGDKITPYEIITYDSLFFGRNSQVKNTVLYKGGQLSTVMLDDTDETFEDSFAITNSFTKSSATKLTEVRSKVLNGEAEIFSYMKVGDKVTYHDNLIHFDENYVSGFKELDNLKSDSLDIINDAKSNKLKATSTGVITNIIVYYNAEKEELSETLKTIVKLSDSKLMLEKGYTGKVDSGFSEYGTPLKEGDVLIKYHIEKTYDMTYGDKAVSSLQLKATVGEVIEDIVTEDGEQIDIKFGNLSVAARIVESPMELGSTYAILKEANKQVVLEYNK